MVSPGKVVKRRCVETSLLDVSDHVNGVCVFRYYIKGNHSASQQIIYIYLCNPLYEEFANKTPYFLSHNERRVIYFLG